MSRIADLLDTIRVPSMVVGGVVAAGAIAAPVVHLNVMAGNQIQYVSEIEAARNKDTVLDKFPLHYGVDWDTEKAKKALDKNGDGKLSSDEKRDGLKLVSALEGCYNQSIQKARESLVQAMIEMEQ